MSKKPQGPQQRIQPRHAARQMCVQALYQWQLHQQEKSAQLVIQEFYNQPVDDAVSDEENWSMLKKQADQKLFETLFIGIVKEQSTLDQQIEPLLDRSFSELDPIELAILRLGTFEMIHSLSVPYRVIINEGVELAKRFGATDSFKYINGILDKLAYQFRLTEVQAFQKRHE